MAKRRIPKSSKKRLIVFGTLSVIIIGYFIFNLFYNLYRLYSLKKEEKNYTTELSELKRENKILNAEIGKLKDPEYIAKFAREQFSYSKDGEYIIKINNEENEKKDDSLEINFDYNYIIYGGTILFIIIFIYALKKR